MYDYDYESYLDELRAEALDKLGPFCNDPDHEHDYSLGLRGEPIKVADKKFETKDSGKKAKYNDGMQRDTTEGKPQFALLFPEGVPYEDQLMTRVADLYHRGGVKYGPRNWEKSSTQESLDHHKECLMRHVIKFMLGVEDGEDHAAAVVWNVNAVDLTRRKMNTLPDNETTQRIDAFLDSHKEPMAVKPFPRTEFQDGDELTDKDGNWWSWSTTDRAWYSKAMFVGISEIGQLANGYGPLYFHTGAYAGLTILKDGSKRWG